MHLKCISSGHFNFASLLTFDFICGGKNELLTENYTNFPKKLHVRTAVEICMYNKTAMENTLIYFDIINKRYWRIVLSADLPKELQNLCMDKINAITDCAIGQ